jgi:hypothetical protein
MMAGKCEYWCETCGCWGSHDANHHDAWKQCNKEFSANKKRNMGSDPTGNDNVAAVSGNDANKEVENVTPPGPVGGGHLSMLK